MYIDCSQQFVPYTQMNLSDYKQILGLIHATRSYNPSQHAEHP